MSSYEPQDGLWINTRHNRAIAPYGEYLTFIDEVEKVWKGDLDLPQDIADSELETARPSEPYALQSKMEKMLAVRSKRSYEVVINEDLDNEVKRADRLERFLRAYYRKLRSVTKRDPVRDAVSLALLRGRSGTHTIYEPNRKEPVIRPRVYDPKEYFPVYGEDDVDWFTTERWKRRDELIDFFDGLPAAARGKLDIPNLHLDPERLAEDNSLQWCHVVEYWDEDWFAWSVDGWMVGKYKHEDGLNLQELKFGATLLKDPRWECMPLLGPILDDLKSIAILQGKMQTGVEAFYYPLTIIQTPEGDLVRFDPFAPPGTYQSLGPDTKVTVITPQVNHQALQMLLNQHESNVSKNTLSQIAFTTDIPNVAGFVVSQYLSIIQDNLADFRDQIEVVHGLVSGDVLRLHEKHAPSDGWSYPLAATSSRGRHRVERVRAEDIAGHYDVIFRLKPSLPQDVLQKATIYNQLVQRDQVTGRWRVDPDTGLELSGLAEDIEDRSAARQRNDWYYLLDTDQEANALYREKIKSDYASELRAMQKDIEQSARKDKKRGARDAARKFELGERDDVVIPAEIASNPQMFSQVAELVAQGRSLEQALAEIQQGGNIPSSPQLTNPQQGKTNPQVQTIMAQLQEGAGNLENAPDGFTGYEGIAPQTLPPALQGAQPRQVADQARLQVDNAEELARRGALGEPS